MDGNGLVDVVWLDATQSGATVPAEGFHTALQTAPGVFEQFTTRLVPGALSLSVISNPDGMTLIDLDDDTDLDLVIGSAGDLRTYLQTAPGRFELDRLLGNGATGSAADSSTGFPVDLDGDGELDLVGIGRALGSVDGPGAYWGGDE